MKRTDPNSAPGTTGRVLHAAMQYDWLLWLATFGRERRFRETILDVAHIRAGEAVLDVGCGTGTLAVAAKRRTGSKGPVYGVDASPEMIERARAKARKAGVAVAFENALGEALPFPDGRFDVVLSTIMLHHLPAKARLQSVQEMRRVLRPGGRVLAVEFETSATAGHGLLRYVARARHGHVKADDVLALFDRSGFTIAQNGALGGNMHFTLAVAE